MQVLLAEGNLPWVSGWKGCHEMWVGMLLSQNSDCNTFTVVAGMVFCHFRWHPPLHVCQREHDKGKLLHEITMSCNATVLLSWAPWLMAMLFIAWNTDTCFQLIFIYVYLRWLQKRHSRVFCFVFGRMQNLIQNSSKTLLFVKNPTMPSINLKAICKLLYLLFILFYNLSYIQLWIFHICSHHLCSPPHHRCSPRSTDRNSQHHHNKCQWDLICLGLQGVYRKASS